MAWTYKATVTASNSGSAKTNYQHKISLTLGDTTVDSEAASGQKVVPVAATTGFTAGDYVILDAGNANEEWGQIDTISAGVSITLLANLTNTHAVSVVVSNADQHIVDNTQSAGEDLRVTPVGDTSSVLDHWIEIWDGTDHRLWVEIPSIGGSGSTDVDIHYGGGAVSSTSDPDTTFLFAQDMRIANEHLDFAGSIANPKGAFIWNHDGFTNGQIAIHGGAGWRSTSVREQSNIVLDGSTYRILVSGDDSANQDTGMYTASSLEGTWTEYGSNPIVPQAEDPYIVIDIDTNLPWTDGSGNYYFFFERKTGAEDIGIARTADWSTFNVWDGSAWTATVANHTAVIAKGGVGAPDELLAGSPCAFVSGSTVYIMYEMRDSGSTETTGLATVSTTNIAADPDQIAKSFTDGGPFTVGPEVIDDIQLIDGTYWIVGHDDLGNMRRYKTTTAPASWATNSFTQDGYNPFENGGHSVNLVHAGTDATGIIGRKYGTWQRTIGTTGINLVLFGGGDLDVDTNKWQAISSERQEETAETVFDSTNKVLRFDMGVSTDESWGFYTTNTPLPATNFSIMARRRTVATGVGDNAFTAMAFGTGDATSLAGTLFYPLILTGVLYTIFDPGSNGVQLREYNASALVGTVDDDQAEGAISDAQVEAWAVHELMFVDDALNGYVEMQYDGTLFAGGATNGTLTNDLTSGAKNILIGQGNRSAAPTNGGDGEFEWLAVRVYDGTDTTNAIGQPASENVASLPAAASTTSPNSLRLGGGRYSNMGVNIITR